MVVVNHVDSMDGDQLASWLETWPVHDGIVPCIVETICAQCAGIAIGFVTLSSACEAQKEPGMLTANNL